MLSEPGPTLGWPPLLRHSMMRRGKSKIKLMPARRVRLIIFKLLLARVRLLR